MGIIPLVFWPNCGSRSYCSRREHCSGVLFTDTVQVYCSPILFTPRGPTINGDLSD
ncbi:hypothetical protein SLEP1_g60404 [Rubroshorea leprosula]|uniref:Uncharacterized protein n=1 Tax=Rubroshorea leprosula TaxID=152421 RepID=A0AAV5MV75_9ROSI|nr:hypothetical protein SLEP1_g60404 [Rubroshorea leprosula]